MNKKLLIFVLILAFLLRFYKLGEIPISLNWDENSNAYNAFSILKTGRDEYGNKFPLYNRSFDDYKPPLYMYLSIPSVAVFGLTPLAARLPSAALGVLTILTVFFLTRQIFKSSDHKELIALFAAFLLTIAPWHILFSRVGLEANVGLFTTAFAITLFLYALEKKYLLLLSAIFIALSFYSYHAQRLFVPMIFTSIILLKRNEFIKVGKKVAIGIFLIVLMSAIPLFTIVPKEAIFRRLSATSSDFIKENVSDSSLLILQDRQVGLNFLSIIHNRRLEVAKSYFENFLLNFDPNFLFIRGDGNLRHSLNNFGVLSIYFMPLIIAGMYLLAKKDFKIFLLLSLWLVFAVVPASIATPAPHAIRSLLMIIPLVIFASVGLTNLYKSKMFYKIPLFAFIFFMTFSFARFLYDYFYNYPVYSAQDWQFGYSQAAKYTEELPKEFSKIYIDASLEQAYIFWLFNLKINPRKIQNASKSHFGRYYFESPPQNSKDILVAKVQNFPEDYLVLKTINYPDSKQAIKIGHSK